MGWTIPYHTPHRRDLIRKIVEAWEYEREGDGAKVRVVALKYCYRGGVRSGVLYVVREKTITLPDGRTESERFIQVDLLRYYAEGRGIGNWGYKDMSACEGPLVTSCPLSYLEMVPECPEDSKCYCRGWRQRVRERRAQRAQKVGA